MEDEGVVRITILSILLAITVVMLTIYGVTLARMGIDHEVAMVIGGSIGSVFGFGLKSLVDIIIRSQDREENIGDKYERDRTTSSYGDNYYRCREGSREYRRHNYSPATDNTQEPNKLGDGVHG